MFLSLATLAKYDFNKRKMTEDDFFQICADKGVTVYELDVVTSFYMKVLDTEIIVIDKKLKGMPREFAMFHEAFHLMQHYATAGPAALFQGLCDTKEEHEADAFACIALIPLMHIFDRSFMDDCCCGFAETVYRKRLHLFETYGI